MPLFVAVILVGHAVMHVGAVACGLLFTQTPQGLVTSVGLDLAVVRPAAVALASLAVAGYVLGALAVAGLVVPSSWWRPLVATASVASAVLLVALFSGPAVPGLVIDAVLLWAVVFESWQPAPSLG